MLSQTFLIKNGVVKGTKPFLGPPYLNLVTDLTQGDQDKPVTKKKLVKQQTKFFWVLVCR